MTRMTAAEYRAQSIKPNGKAKRVDRETPVHISILQLLQFVLPDRAVIHHSPNELQIAADPVSKAIAMTRAKRMGMRTGWPDLEFLLDGVMHFMEVKVGDGVETDAQKGTRIALLRGGARCAVVRSVDDAEAALRSWGLI